jgi:uncharacterized protein (TIGR02118 family)
MFKVVTLLKRRPGMAVEAFQRYWKEQHAPLLSREAPVRRYVQSHALAQGYATGELLFDGIEEAWFDSEAALRTFTACAAHERVRQDDLNFLDTSRTVYMLVDVQVVKDGAIPARGVKNIEFVNRRPGMPLEAFRRYWRTVHGPLASKIPSIRRYEQNHLKLTEYAAGAAPAYDGLAITWFDSTADMKRGAATPEYAATRGDEANFLPDGHLPIIVTREHVVVDER